MKRIEAVNDFVIKFANVNGSGSASANELFAKSFLRMGIPVSPRNIFPSNIQGLPTWYEVRVTEKGHLGRRGGVDLMVAMNPQTWNQDLKEVDPGGYLFYDNTKPLPKSKFRDDINVIGMPLTEITNASYTDARERQLFKNIIYVGALAGMLGIEPDVIAELIGEQYKGKEKLLKPNLNAFHMGLDFARHQLERGPGIHEHVWSWNFSYVRIHRPRLLRRDPGDHHRRAARRPLDRHAHAHAAVRCPHVRLRLVRRHQAHPALPRGPARVLRVRGAVPRPRRPLPDAGVHDDGPGHRHEPAPGEAAGLGRQPPVRPRQGDDRRDARGRQGVRPLPRRGQPRPSVPHLS